MDTIKLYDEAPYKTEFEARVIKVNGADVILDRTLFFPEEGGQCADRGTLEDVPVKDVQIHGTTIVHTMAADDLSFKEGDTVHGVIDWGLRFSNMQNHSAEHIISGLVHEIYGYDNVGFHLGHDEITMDYNGVLTSADLRALEHKANRIVWDNRPVLCEYPAQDVLSRLDYRSKKDIDGPVRIVTIEGVDVCACCAPHVRTTGEIGLVRLIKCEKNRGNTRVYMAAGESALALSEKEADVCTALCQLLSANDETLYDYVEALVRKNGALESRLKHMALDHARTKVNEAVQAGQCVVFDSDMDINGAKILVNDALKDGADVMALMIGNCAEGYRFVLAAKDDARTHLERLKALGGRGGGNQDMVQGMVKADEETIREALERK